MLRSRDHALAVGPLIRDWTGVLTETLWVAPDTLEVTAPRRVIRPLLDAGKGAILHESTPDGRRFRLAGPMTTLEESDKECTVLVTSDSRALWTRTIWADHTKDWTAQPTGTSGDVLTLSGPVETVALELIRRNLGQSALPYRREVTVPASQGRGPAVDLTVNTAANVLLGDVVADLLKVTSLRVVIEHDLDAAALVVRVLTLPDKTTSTTYGTTGRGNADIGTDWSAKYQAPEVNAALTIGGDVGGRVRLEVADSDSQAQWAERVERVVSANGVAVADLQAAGDDALADGASLVDIDAPIPDRPNRRLGTDVPLGSLVGLNLHGRYLTERVRQITTVIADGEKVTRSGRVGTDGAGLSRDQKRWIATTKRLSRLER